ncbi:MgtC/SapB family protein [Pseudolabrys taiwanensis]|uniref:Protein MgtC n=1 Tax=Pseudolabrys taiwanensis TaxID=331696 RepID=A0A345ZS54_9HYPH|nr:MgtC/SapB family protein [Pseudolabrys taiwanensis]AXK79751.1 MgtC/SapB family protein [Pseudolabrys taiwanensis]
MALVNSFATSNFLDSLASFFIAFVLGTLIGAERQYRQRSGGLRTNVLVAVGAAAFVDIAMRLSGNDGAVRVIAYVVSGVGFLGAGVIMKEGKNVWGLNTAATLWCSAAVGACAGSDLAAEAVALTVFVLAGNTLLRPLVNAINRAPISEKGTEAVYEVRATTDLDRLEAARELIESKLEAAHYPLRGVAVEGRDEGSVELIATLIASAANSEELDDIVVQLERSPSFDHASWTVRSPE